MARSATSHSVLFSECSATRSPRRTPRSRSAYAKSSTCRSNSVREVSIHCPSRLVAATVPVTFFARPCSTRERTVVGLYMGEDLAGGGLIRVVTRFGILLYTPSTRRVPEPDSGPDWKSGLQPHEVRLRGLWPLYLRGPPTSARSAPA